MEGRAGSLGTAKLVALTFVVGTVLGLSGMALWAAVDDGGDDGAATVPSSLVAADELQPQSDDSSKSPTTPAAAADTRAQRCLDAANELEAPLEAAGPALDQWDVHVGAMNQLVAGEITLQQATQFWERTRQGAHRNVERFHTAMADLKATGIDCPAPDLVGRAPTEVRSCARLVDAELGVLRAARSSVRTWGTHVHHMDMLRMGTMSPDDATAMWVTMWQRGVQEIRDYRTAMQAPGMKATCPNGGSGG